MGFGELLVILFLVLLFFGAGKLRGVGAGLGKAARGFKEAMGGEEEKRKPGAQPPRE
jgi:TatA/E family protein of Tat protein translocase